MALAFNGVSVELVSSKIPSAYVKTPVTKFADGEYTTIKKEYLIPKSSVENADASVAFTALVAALDTAIQTELSEDYTVASLTVTAYTDFNYLALDSCGAADSSSLYTDTAPNFICGVTTLVKTEAI